MDTPIQQTQQLPPAPPQQSVPLSAPHRSHTLPMFLIAIIMLLIGLGAGYIFGKGQQTPVTPSNTSIQSNTVTTALTTPSSIPSPTTDTTANWQTYTNQKYGYSLKYPTTLITTNPPSSDHTVLFQQQQGSMLPTWYVTVLSQDTSNDGSAYNYVSPQSVDKYFALAVGSSDNQGSYTSFTRLPDIQVGGQTAVVIENSKVVEFPGKDRRILIKKGNLTYEIGVYYQTADELNAFQTFLSTFSFL